MSRLFAFLRRLAQLEPVMLIAVITAIVMLLGIWGIDAAELGDKVGASINLIWPAVVLVAAAWTRTKTSASAAVVQVVAPDGTVTAGPASLLPTGTVVSF